MWSNYSNIKFAKIATDTATCTLGPAIKIKLVPWTLFYFLPSYKNGLFFSVGIIQNTVMTTINVWKFRLSCIYKMIHSPVFGVWVTLCRTSILQQKFGATFSVFPVAPWNGSGFILNCQWGEMTYYRAKVFYPFLWVKWSFSSNKNSTSNCQKPIS